MLTVGLLRGSPSPLTRRNSVSSSVYDGGKWNITVGGQVGGYNDVLTCTGHSTTEMAIDAIHERINNSEKDFQEFKEDLGEVKKGLEEFRSNVEEFTRRADESNKGFERQLEGFKRCIEEANRGFEMRFQYLEGIVLEIHQVLKGMFHSFLVSINH